MTKKGTVLTEYQELVIRRNEDHRSNRRVGGDPKIEWKTLRELYYIRKGVEQTRIVGTALAIFAALLEYNVQTWLQQPYYWFRGSVRDGYSVSLLGPFVWIWWLAYTGLVYLPVVGLNIGLFMMAGLWTMFFEYPAEYLRGD